MYRDDRVDRIGFSLLLQFHVDPETPVERQIQDLLKKLPDVLRIKKQGEMEGVVSGALRCSWEELAYP